jgi:hypothetical protein
VICGRCRDAADQRLPADQHCTDPGCTCGHRVERYGEAAEHCRAEFHHPTMHSARCDLPAGHAEFHREQPDPSRCAFRWDEQDAMYPTDTTTED